MTTMTTPKLTPRQRRALLYMGRRPTPLKELRENGFNLRVVSGLTSKGLAYWSSDGLSCSLNDAGIRIYLEDDE
jgi:hypothetical protein